MKPRKPPNSRPAAVTGLIARKRFSFPFLLHYVNIAAIRIIYGVVALMHYSFHRKRWFESEADIETGIRMAERILQACIGTRIIAVGQSAAWLTHIIGRLQEARGLENQTQIIPFSGSFLSHSFKISECLNPPPVYKPGDNKKWPTNKAVRAYFNHIADYKADPAHVARTKTSFVDMVETGAGYASFAALYMQEAARRNIANDVLANADFHVLTYRRNNPPSAWQLWDDQRQCHIVPLHHHLLNVEEKLVINSMSDGNALTEISNRIVPYYPLNEGDAPAPIMPHNQIQIERVKNAIEPVLRKYIQASAPKAG